MKAAPERENGPYFCYEIGRFKSRGSRSIFSPKNRVISYNLRRGLGVAKPQRYSARERRCVIKSNLPNDPGLSSPFWSSCQKNGSLNYVIALRIISLIDISKRSDAHYFIPTKNETLACSRSINRSSFEKKIPSRSVNQAAYICIYLFAGQFNHNYDHH